MNILSRSCLHICLCLALWAGGSAGAQSVLPGSELPVQQYNPPIKSELPVQQYNRPINPNLYLIRPGETLRLAFLGTQITDLDLNVDAEGRIVHREIGLHPVAGLSLTETREMLDTVLASLYPNSTVEISVGAPRLVSIDVSGWVKNPGRFTGFTSQTVGDMIDSAGGLSAQASHRAIRFIGGARALTVDLDKTASIGDNKSNPNLYAGFSVFVPKMKESVVSVVGHVRRPKEIELINGDKLSNLIAIAGGITADADISSVYIMNDSLRDIRLPGNIHSGDIIVVPPKSLEEQSVFIHGAIMNPGIIPYTSGMTIQRLLDVSGGLTAKANRGRITVFRRATGDVMSSPPQERYPISSSGLSTLSLNPGDSVVVPNQLGYVKVFGSVKRSGFYPYVTGNTVSQYILTAGGTVSGLKKSKLFLYDRVSELTFEVESGAILLDGDAIIVNNRSDSSEDK